MIESYLFEYEVVPLQGVQGLNSEIFTRRIWTQGQCMCHPTKILMGIKVLCATKCTGESHRIVGSKRIYHSILIHLLYIVAK